MGHSAVFALWVKSAVDGSLVLVHVIAVHRGCGSQEIVSPVRPELRHFPVKDSFVKALHPLLVLCRHLKMHYRVHGSTSLLLRFFMQPHDVAFRVLEGRYPSHALADLLLRHDDSPPVGGYGPARLLDGFDADVVHEGLPWILALHQAAVYAGRCRLHVLTNFSGLDNPVVVSVSHLKFVDVPAKGAFVEGYGSFHIVRRYLKMHDRVFHVLPPSCL